MPNVFSLEQRREEKESSSGGSDKCCRRKQYASRKVREKRDGGPACEGVAFGRPTNALESVVPNAMALHMETHTAINRFRKRLKTQSTSTFLTLLHAFPQELKIVNTNLF